METKLRKQMAELREILNSIEKKKEQDIAIYGKPLKNKVMMDKADSKKRAIKLTKKSIKKIEEEEQKKLERKFKLSKRDAKVLDSIRKGTSIGNTTSHDKGSKWDNRFNGSKMSRDAAKHYNRRKFQ